MLLLKYDCVKADEAGIMISAIQELKLLNIEVQESEYVPQLSHSHEAEGE